MCRHPTTFQGTTIVQRHDSRPAPKVEEYHKSLKSNLALTKAPTRTTVTQTNHVMCSIWAFVKLELLRVKTTSNHFALTTKLYMAALRTAFEQLQALEPHRLAQPAA